MSSGGIAIPDVFGDKSKGVQFQINLAGGEDEHRCGKEIRQRVLDAIKQGPGDDDAIRLLGLLVAKMPRTVLRIPELYDYLEHLAQHGYHSAVARIVGDYGRGRRRREPFLIIGLVDLVLQHEGGSVAKAAMRVKELYGKELAIDARYIQNAYCKYKGLYDLYRTGHYLADEKLTDRMWSR